MRSPSKHVNLPKFKSNVEKRFTKENLDLNKYLTMKNTSIICSSDDDNSDHSENHKNESIIFSEEE